MKSPEEMAQVAFSRREAYKEEKEEREYRRERLYRRVSAITMAVLCVAMLGTGYVFAAAFGVIDDFLGFFEKRNGSALSEKQQQYVEQACAEIGESVTYDGVTVTVQGAITDGKTYYIYLDIVAPEDVSLEALNGHGLGFTRTLRSENPYRHDVSSVSGGCIPIEDYDGKSNTISMILQTTVMTPYYSEFSFADGYERTLYLENLSAYSEEYPFEQYTIAEGLWSFKFTFAQAAENDQPIMEVLVAPIICHCNRLSGESISVSVDSIKLNALGATLYYSYVPGSVREAIDFGRIQIVMKDGSIVNAHPRSAVSGSVSYVYDAPVLFSDIEHLIINEQIIPVE